MKNTVIAIAASIIIAPTAALAHSDNEQSVSYQGPTDITSVQSLIDDTSFFGDRDIVLEGYLVKQVRKDTFVFSDGEAEIEVELDDDINMTTPIDHTTKLRLFGEYEGGMNPEVEVDHVQVL